MKWNEVLLEHICVMQTGKTPPTDRIEYFNGTVNWFNPSDIGVNKVLVDSKRKISEIALTEKRATSFQANSVLITCIGEIGRCGIIREKASSNQQITALTFDTRVDVDYAYYWFVHNRSRLKNVSNDALVPILNNATLKRLSFQFPPLPTQQKIAAILDEADALRRKDKALLAKYDELLHAVFYDMFGDPVKNEKGWEVGIIRDIVTEVKYGTSKPAEDSGLYPYLRMNNITYTGDWDFASMKYINLTDSERDKYLLRKGDLVFNRTNSRELVGKTAVYDSDKEMAIAGYLIRVRTNERANPNYISMYLNSKHGKKTLMEMCKSIIGMANINAQELQEIKVMIPPMDLQNQFASIYKEIQHLKSQIIQQQTYSENLFQSLMQRAFKGELVD